MKRMLYFLNLTDEEGRLNFTHGIVIGAAINLFLNHNLESSGLMLSSFALLALSWKVIPHKSRKASIDEIDVVNQRSQEALDQIKKLNLKLGFR